MNKLLILTKRNIKEIIRDPLSLVFCLGFPIVMLVLMQLIMSSVEYTPANFLLNNYSVGIAVFGFTFVMLFTSSIIASDKNSEFKNRIDMAPINKSTYFFSFMLSGLPLMLAQSALFFAIALCFGLQFSPKILLAIVYLVPSMLLYLSIGILVGIICSNEKQAGPICSIFVTLVSLLGGVFMPIAETGAFGTFATYLPFVHSVQIASGLFTGNLGSIYPHVLWVIGYTILIWAITLLILKFRKK